MGLCTRFDDSANTDTPTAQPRRMVLGGLAALSTLLLAGLAAEPATADERPNILWISVEDMSSHVGCFGDPLATTPHLDRLATEGIRYRQAFATAGVCAPARSCIITGVFPTSLGSHHMRCRGRLPSTIWGFPEYLRQAGYYCSNNSKTDYNFRHRATTWDESGGRAHWRKRPDPKQPFFAVFNLGTTHESRIASDARYKAATAGLPKSARHDRKKLKLPPYYPDTPATREHWGRYYDVVTAMDRQVADLLKQLEEDGLAESTIVIWFSDHGVGLPRAKRWLYDSGMRVPMIVRIPEKFRRYRTAAVGAETDELVSFVDLAPTMLNLAGIEIPQHMQGRAFLGPRLTPRRQYVFGARDRMDERYDIIRAVRDTRYKYIRNYEAYKPYYQYMNTPEKGVVMSELRRLHAADKLPPAARQFMADHKPLEELYDLRHDPHELNNLAASPSHREVLDRMRSAHIGWVKRTIDVGLIPEPEIHALQDAADQSIYELARSKDGIPIAAIRNVAAQGERGAEALSDLRKALAARHATLRYWAAIGLGNLDDAAAEAVPELRERLKDSSPVVRIAAARALYRIAPEQAAKDGRALKSLVASLASRQQWERLMAAIALDELGPHARPAAQPLREALKDRENKYVVRVANRALNVLFGTDNKVR